MVSLQTCLMAAEPRCEESRTRREKQTQKSSTAEMESAERVPSGRKP